MSKEELDEWYALKKQLLNEEISENDYRELLRLNHLVMEASHQIHNENMMRGRNDHEVINFNN